MSSKHGESTRAASPEKTKKSTGGKASSSAPVSTAVRHKHLQKAHTEIRFKPTRVRKLLLRAHVPRASPEAKDMINHDLLNFLKDLLYTTAVYTKGAGRKTISSRHLVEAATKHGLGEIFASA